MHRIPVSAIAAVFAVSPAFAFEKLEGYFIASKACEAYQSKNKMTNPGEIMTEASKSYVMLGLNAPGGDFFQIEVPDAPVIKQRWVSTGCGNHVVKADTDVASQDSTTPAVIQEAGVESTDNLLTLSWQPAFCESKSSKTECKQVNDGLLPITEQQLSIHGLWPQPEGKAYCGVPNAVKKLDKPESWDELPDVGISAETKELLDVSMPGTASFLERHEWIKHGTCYKGVGGSEEYFRELLYLTDAINMSAVSKYLASQVGAEVDIQDIRAKFDDAFGAGSGERVAFKCVGDGSRTLLSEIWISLAGTIDVAASVGDLIRAAKPVPAGCRTATIDPAGLQ